MNEVIDIEPAKSPATSTALAAVPSTTPAALLAMAVQQGADLDKLERLMALQERWEANEARKANVEITLVAHSLKKNTTGFDAAHLSQISWLMSSKARALKPAACHTCSTCVSRSVSPPFISPSRISFMALWCA